jgi:hypothetical protein
MAQGKLKRDLVLKRARQTRVIRRRIADEAPAEVKPGLGKIQDRTKPGK